MCVCEWSLGLLVVCRLRAYLRYCEIRELLARGSLALPWLPPQTGSTMSLQYSLAYCGLQTLCFGKLFTERQISCVPTATGHLMVASHLHLVTLTPVSQLLGGWCWYIVKRMSWKFHQSLKLNGYDLERECLAPSSQERGFWVWFHLWAFKCGVCMFPLCFCGLSLVSFLRPNTYVRSI